MKRINCASCDNIPCPFRSSHSTKWIETYHFQSGQHIFREHMPVTGIYVVHKGKVKEYYQDKKGKEKTLKVACNGEMFGHINYRGIRHVRSAVTADYSQICFLKKDSLYDFCKNNPASLFKLMNFLLTELKRSDMKFKRFINRQNG